MINNIKDGLNEKEVIQSIKKYGTNKISKKEKNSFIKLFIESLGDPIIKILLIALGIKIVFLLKDFDWYETIGIVIAIFIASFISTISEYGSEKAFLSMQEEASKLKCKVKRSGKMSLISIDEVVTGDIVVLESGDKVPADGKIIEGDISVDESAINGESKETYKKAVRTLTDVPTLENLVYRGSTVYSKKALMQVTSVGDNTVYGKIAKELQESQPPSPLKLKLSALAKTISKIGYVGAILVSISYLFAKIVIDNNFNIDLIVKTLTNLPVLFGYILYALTLSVTIIVVSVPEGLPMMITLVLSSNMRRMLKNNVLVRKMVGIETSGSINILFTDKTGTLTKGNMEMIGLISGNLKEYNNIYELDKFNEYSLINKISMYYNNSSSVEKGNIIGGNLTDKAIMKFLSNSKIPSLNVIDVKEFDSEKKYSSVYVDYKDKITLIKGAPELIINSCKYCYNESGSVKLFTNRREIQNKIDIYTKNGIRVLALATSSSKNVNFHDNLTFVSLVLIKDEVRTEAKKGLELISKAHIKTVMITGDNKNTAMSIAREVGLLNSDNDIVLTHEELDKLTDEELIKIIPNLKIVSRSLPQDKSRLVNVAEKMGLVVGMTGDGVNDAPALKKADVGFSMGSGCEVAKEASDIIILDDNLLSIASAILYGRTIFKSIRKFIIFQLTVNLCAIGLSIIGPFIRVDTPVTVIQMLWINMVMDTLAGIAFSYEPALIEYMDEYPKRRNESIINKYMLHQILFTGLYSFIVCIIFLKSNFIAKLFRMDNNNLYLMTAFFGLFIFITIFNSFNTRTHRLNIFASITKNKVFLIVILFIFLVQVFLLYFGGTLFRTAGLTFKEFEIMILMASSVIPVDFLRKLFLRKKGIIGGV